EQPSGTRGIVAPELRQVFRCGVAGRPLDHRHKKGNRTLNDCVLAEHTPAEQIRDRNIDDERAALKRGGADKVPDEAACHPHAKALSGNTGSDRFRGWLRRWRLSSTSAMRAAAMNPATKPSAVNFVVCRDNGRSGGIASSTICNTALLLTPS